MKSNFEQFSALHQIDTPFILPNVWNVKSALLFQELNYPAIATSSMAVAHSLGYDDGEAMPFEEYLFIIKRILANTKSMLSVDMEMGYGATDEEVFDNLQRLADLGVVGVNLEDSYITKSVRGLKNADVFASSIEWIINKLKARGLQVFINIRCDTYILNVDNKETETAQRLKRYEAAGANGVFLPCVYEEKDIAQCVSNTGLPLNVMLTAGLPNLDILRQLGVKRVSMGPYLFNKLYSQIHELAKGIEKSRSLNAILS